MKSIILLYNKFQVLMTKLISNYNQITTIISFQCNIKFRWHLKIITKINCEYEFWNFQVSIRKTNKQY